MLQRKGLKIDNQGRTGHCGGFTFAKLLEIVNGKHYDGHKLWKLIDDTMEHSNKGGIAIGNIFAYLKRYGYDGVKLESFERINKYPKSVPAKYQTLKTQKDLDDFIARNDIVAVNIQGFRYNRYSKRFYGYPRNRGSHIMPVVKVNGSEITVHNSWGQGEATFNWREIPYVTFYGGKLTSSKMEQVDEINKGLEKLYRGVEIEKLTRAETIKRLKKYFHIKELVPKVILTKYGETAWRVFDTALLHNMLFIREDTKKPMVVNKKGKQYRGYDNSGYRPKTSLSYHKLGKAVDFDLIGWTPHQTRQYIKDNYKRFPHPYGRIEVLKGGKEINWVHYDVGGDEQTLQKFNT